MTDFFSHFLLNDLNHVLEFFVFISLPLHILGILAAMQAIMQARTATAAIAWAIALITYPHISLFFYLILGRDRVTGYIRKIELLKEKLQFAKESAKKEIIYEQNETVPKKLAYLEKLTQMPFTYGNHMELLINGESTFGAIFDAIRHAENYILVQFYILRDDTLGIKLQNHLIQKANEGVKVYVLYDDIGSYALSRSFIRKFQQANIEIHGFQNKRTIKNRFQVNFRNHRKIFIIDGNIGFVGGHNLGQEYLSGNKKFSLWRDTHLKLEGPIVQCVQLAFFEDWYWTCQKHLYLNWNAETSKHSNMTAFALITGPDTKVENNLIALINLVNSAKKRIWIASPYFVPDPAFLYALRALSYRGIEIKILLPKKPDKWVVFLAAYAFIDLTKYSSIEFYQYNEGFMHQKVILIDDTVSMIGTTNIDNRSFRLNFEISILNTNTKFNRKVEAMLEKDFAESTLLPKNYFSRKPFWFKLACKTARLFAPVL